MNTQQRHEWYTACGLNVESQADPLENMVIDDRPDWMRLVGGSGLLTPAGLEFIHRRAEAGAYDGLSDD